MLAVRSALLACILLAACDGNPFVAGKVAPVVPVVPIPVNVSVSSLPGTTNATSTGNITRTEARDKGPEGGEVYGNGFAEGYSYNPAGDTFSVDNLAFDGANVYTRSPAFMTTLEGPDIGPARVYEGAGIVQDNQTGADIDQFSYRALYGVSRTGRTNFAIVRTGGYVPYGFGGFIYSRNGGVVLPTSGQAKYTGAYSGLRDFSGRGGMEITSGDMEMSIDFNDFNPDEGGTGNGAGIRGRITNRHVFDLEGNDITASVLAEINDVKNPDFDLTQLPTLLFKVGPGVLDNNGEAEGHLDSTIFSNGKAEGFEDGRYYAIIAGDNADEVVGVIVVTSDLNGVTVRETGGFILYRP